MKLNGTVRNRRGILRDNIPDIEDFRNLKSQAPNFNEIPNVNSKEHNRFVIWYFGHCDLFDICYLRFGIFHQNQKVSLTIKLAAFQASGRAKS
jgi:hypothetical protein